MSESTRIAVLLGGAVDVAQMQVCRLSSITDVSVE